MEMTFTKKCLAFLFLTVWFFVWVVCPWDSAMPGAQAAEAAHAHHGHQPMQDGHHASKGTEHSCSGSVSYNTKVKNDRPGDAADIFQGKVSFPEPALYSNKAQTFQKPLFERSVLPKLLTEYYQLHAVYRI